MVPGRPSGALGQEAHGVQDDVVRLIADRAEHLASSARILEQWPPDRCGRRTTASKCSVPLSVVTDARPRRMRRTGSPTRGAFGSAPDLRCSSRSTVHAVPLRSVGSRRDRDCGRTRRCASPGSRGLRRHRPDGGGHGRQVITQEGCPCCASCACCASVGPGPQGGAAAEAVEAQDVAQHSVDAAFVKIRRCRRAAEAAPLNCTPVLVDHREAHGRRRAGDAELGEQAREGGVVAVV